MPEPIQAILNDGRVLSPTTGNIEYYFKAFGSIAALCIQVKLKIGSRKEQMDAIAQVTAECDGQKVFSIMIAPVLTIYSCRGTTHEKGFTYLYLASFVTGTCSNSSCLMAALSLPHSVAESSKEILSLFGTVLN